MPFSSQKQNSGERERATFKRKIAHLPCNVYSFIAARDRFPPDFYHLKNTIPKC